MIAGTFRQRGLVCTDHVIEVPLDHDRPDGPRIEVYAREVVTAAKADADLPRLLFLQGGPGGKAVRPASGSGFVGRALDDHRVVLLDQRGTGRSTPANRRTLARLGGPAEQAAYLAHFRADAIVRDAEALRREIGGGRPWTTLGQSYGGFITMAYLSLAPEGLRRSFVTGGLPTLTGTADDVYGLTFDRTLEKNEEYFARHPGDRDLCARIVGHLRERDVRMPTGERLSPRRFQGLGLGLGTRAGFDTLHFLLEEAFVEGPDGPELSDTFLAGVHDATSLAARPLYALFQEPIYAQGGATNWAAERVYRGRPEFDLEGGAPFAFTGETYYPFNFEEDPALVPLRDTAHLLAAKDDWPRLYDPGRLARNEVPVYAAVYHDDMFVPREFSLETARAVRGLRPWITNEYEHDGLKESTAVLDRLLAMAEEDGA
ncbi:alpha/beta fold hydrolase [Actinomadura sp. WMMB 499]|uniref:alpha/beta fold hydrolase n=1 Tax=Actinomadura sp. WMMB 499 TaxID=1219491 RepID=UPI001244124B|nr:alpha/beta fold hydrolase [Actinomadura sp. WMMB 499]QFG20139.1 alpha/beta hydrolase [Actinomadura sp. WMMB 499]